MESRTLSLLEFPKVLERLAALAVSEPAAAACRAITPFADEAALAPAQRKLAEAVELRRDAAFEFTPFPDIEPLFDVLESERRGLDLDALVALGHVLSRVAALRQALGQGAPGQSLLRDTVAAAPWPKKTQAALARCLSADGRLRDESSPELFSVRQEIRSIHQTITNRVKEFVGEKDMGPFLQDDYVTISSDRYVLPLKANFKGRIPGIIHDYSQTGETVYVEPFFLVEVNNRLQELKNEEREAEARVMAFLTGLAKDERREVAAAYRLLVECDVLWAKAALAERLGGTIPEVAAQNAVHLLAARHPLLVLAAGDDGPKTVTPQDLVLAEDQRALIVTGANAGGKTVCLKTLGLLSVMALSGLPVPAGEGSRLPFFHKVFVFLGDEQSLEDHLSTFTAQIRHLSRVWPDIDARTLVLLDEFGAGTDPSQGAALAQAVVDGLLDRGAYLAAATHFPALKAYGLSRPGVRAACMLFDPATKKPVYRLAYDQVGASIALDVAREHGLPEDILERASRYLLLDGGDAGLVFDRLNDLALRRERELDELAATRKAEAQRVQKLKDGLRKAQDSLVEEIRNLSRDIARRHEAGRLERKEAQKALAEARKRLIEESAAITGETPGTTAPEAGVDLASLAPGQTVRILSWDKTAVVREKDLKRQAAKVDIGGVSLWVPASDMAPAQGQPAKGSVAVTPAARGGAASGLGLVLDIRGMRADVAESELAAFIDTALLRGHGELEIIHGKGTGALRREVHRLLKDHPQVASFALAPEDRGGDGMTMVTLK
ncbi:MutS2 family protein [Solidesulfovibrio carbinoliphilus subsp. oakridgensis]|uniref:Endonuclease MutS2 n=1 Tax=Solidesulfovibrio carbinoliphilus subsp. oakridgensis TaxID=694327 RepID=G7Q600_9BACT|nr:Smr/MutS family protein [Solidesulfovibrio carbinoliphilus]EHJ46937.1 MutS2 family protein [Solidesulfovibrio carbinoliphilus subsp. oakridgensis]